MQLDIIDSDSLASAIFCSQQVWGVSLKLSRCSLLHFEYRLIAAAIFLLVLMEIVDACHGDAVVCPVCSLSLERHVHSLPLVCAEIVACISALGQ